MNTFNEIYILDLHGNSKKKETAPSGGRDINVFDIQQGVATAIFIKKEKGYGCKVFHADLYGERENKYTWLDEHELANSDYMQLNPQSPWYFFIERNTKEIEHYNNWMRVNEIFPVNNVGIVTARDKFAISFDKDTLEARIRQFRNLRFDNEFLKSAYGLKDTSTFKLEKFREEFSKVKNWENDLQIIQYRPFDKRFIIYSQWVIERRIFDIMHNMLKDNLGISVARRVEIGRPFEHAFIADTLITHHTVSLKEVNYLFPLYLYPPTHEKKKKTGIQNMMVFEPEVDYGSSGKKPNIAPKVFEMLEKAYGSKPSPEEILYYCYAVLYSNTYREKYAEFLKIDFPRIPFTSDHKLFLQMAELGSELAALHLLKSKALNNPITKYRGSGEDLIEKPVYDQERQSVFINATKYFEGVSREVWEYHIGGYQVMHKFLKDRKGRQMNDPVIYCKIATAISATIEIQQKLEPLFEKLEKAVLA